VESVEVGDSPVTHREAVATVEVEDTLVGTY
jgi:hypothetical protein